VAISGYYKNKNAMLAHQAKEREIMLAAGFDEKKIKELHAEEYCEWKSDQDFSAHFQYTLDEVNRFYDLFSPCRRIG